jgi:hypothetical protein
MKTFFTYLLLLVAGNSFAQINFEPGTFTNNDGSVVQCLIKNIAWKNNPTEFTYKLSEGSEEKRGTLTDVSAFEVSSYKFERYTVKIERSSTLIGSLDNMAKPDYASETLFLKVLIEGKAVLYAYEDGNLKKYFYSSAAEKIPVQLFHKRYEEDMKVKEYNLYYSQLAHLFADAGYPQETFTKLKYDQESLKKIFIKYNGVDAAVSDKTKGQNKSKFNLKVTTGVQNSSLEVRTETPMYKDSYDFGSTTGPLFGVEAEWILPFNNNKWGLFINPNYRSFKNDDPKTGASGTNPVGWQADIRYISTPIGLRYYMFLNQKSRIFVNAAYVIGIKAGGEIKNANGPLDLVNTTNVMGGVGFAYDRFAAEVRFNQTANTFNYAFISTRYNNTGLVLSYKLL